MDFFEAYAKWEEECLREFNEKCYDRREFCHPPEGDYNPDKLVEFSANGDAYPHSAFGTGHIRGLVTPWEESPFYME